MKTALELLGHESEPGDDCLCAYCDMKGTLEMLEDVAQRAREEMREMAAAKVEKASVFLAKRIRKLPVTS